MIQMLAHPPRILRLLLLLRLLPAPWLARRHGTTASVRELEWIDVCVCV